MPLSDDLAAVSAVLPAPGAATFPPSVLSGLACCR